MSNWIKYHCLYHNKFYLQIGDVPPKKPGLWNRIQSRNAFLNNKERYYKALNDPTDKFHNAAEYKNYNDLRRD